MSIMCRLLFFLLFSHLLVYKVVAQEMLAYTPTITSPKGFSLVDIVFSKRTAGENEIKAGANGRLMTGLVKIDFFCHFGAFRLC